jgi:hypothetical protein
MELEVVSSDIEDIHERRRKTTGCPMTFNDACLALFPIIILALFITSWVIILKAPETVPCIIVPAQPPQCTLVAFSDNQTFYSYVCHCETPCTCFVVKNDQGDITNISLNFNDVTSSFWMSTAVITTIVMLMFISLGVTRFFSPGE